MWTDEGEEKRCYRESGRKEGKKTGGKEGGRSLEGEQECEGKRGVVKEEEM